MKIAFRYWCIFAVGLVGALIGPFYQVGIILFLSRDHMNAMVVVVPSLSALLALAYFSWTCSIARKSRRVFSVKLLLPLSTWIAGPMLVVLVASAVQVLCEW